MKISVRHKLILLGAICPYCNSSTKIVDQNYIYAKTYSKRMILCCQNYPKCDSIVGCDDNGNSLGRLANKSLRQWKKSAHKRFDILWKNNLMSRKEAYNWLSNELVIPPKYTHIGMFSENTCRKTIELCKKKIDEET